MAFSMLNGTALAGDGASISVQKAVNQGDPSNPNQTFTLDIRLGNDFALDPVNVQAGDAPIGQTRLIPRETYSVHETNIPSGWTLDDISCVDRSGNSEFSEFDPGKASLKVMPVDGADVLCTFTNRFVPPGSITVIKSAEPSDGTDFPFTFTRPNT